MAMSPVNAHQSSIGGSHLGETLFNTDSDAYINNGPGEHAYFFRVPEEVIIERVTFKSKDQGSSTMCSV